MALKIRFTTPRPRVPKPAPRPDPDVSLPLVVPEAPLSYSGWLRRSVDGKEWGPWLIVCGARDRWKCWEALLAIPAETAHSERAVTIDGEKP